ncbi:MAG: ATP-binding cassette domain-containing protein, partial [Gordonia amarae]
MITVENLTKRYGDYVALDDVSFTSKPGRVTGFLGPNGAGKSTTMRIIAGLTPAGSGTATVCGTAYRDIPNPATEV